MPEAEKFSSHLPAVLAATAVTVAASLGTSYLGWTGTLTGVVAASLITGGGAWWVERLLRRSAARTRALTEARRRKGRPLNPAETSYIAAISDHQENRRHRGIPWKTASLSAGAVLAATIAVITFIELGTGQPVSGVVRGDHSHGFLVPVAPSAQPAAPASTVPASPSPTLSAQPSVPVVTPTPSPSVIPTVTVAPPTVPASPTATVSPSTPPASPSVFSSSFAPPASPAEPSTG